MAKKKKIKRSSIWAKIDESKDPEGTSPEASFAGTVRRSTEQTRQHAERARDINERRRKRLRAAQGRKETNKYDSPFEHQ